MSRPDVLVVGSGNAAMCAAISAAEQGASVLVVDWAPRDQRGGNSAFTGGAFRVAYDGADDIRNIVPDLSDEEVEKSDFGSYSEDKYFDDLIEMSSYHTDAELADTLTRESLPTLLWLVSHGVRFIPIYGRQSFVVDGIRTYWGGLTVEVSGGGLGLVDAQHEIAGKAGIRFAYGTRAAGLLEENGKVTGILARTPNGLENIHARSVILAAGGFHANAEWRARYLGRNWDLAKVRGCRFNMGDGIRMALDIGAAPAGHWSGCHSVAYDANAPEFGEITLLNQQKNSFPFGVIVNARGERFFDEGANFRNYTYANLGRAILAQPDALAWQIFDDQSYHLLTDEYRMKQMSWVQADTLEELALKLEGVDADGFLSYIHAYNGAVDTATPFNPAVLDGRSARIAPVPKSNWALQLSKPPYRAFKVTCGITFTYGGVRTDSDARVLSQSGDEIVGLYAAGEMQGGLYFEKYPGGAGLMSGSVFGARAGRHAAAYVLGT